MAGVYSELITVQNRPARLWRGGSGAPLLLLHGGMGDASTHWRWCWNALADRYAVYAPDLPGLGGMTAALDAPGYQALVDWTVALLDTLGLQQVAVVGNSFGGALARLLAANHPARVSRALLVNGGRVLSTPGIVRALFKVPGLGNALFALGQRNAVSPQSYQKALADPARLTPELLAEMRRSMPGFSAVMRRAAALPAPAERTPRCPVTIVWGAQDRLVSVKDGQKLLKQITNATFETIEGAGHLPQMEQPEAFVKAVRTFAG